MKKAFLISLAMILALSMVLVGCPDPIEEPVEYFVLGHVVPFTGDLSFVGEEWENSTELAVEHINDAGGVLGRQIKVQYEDSATTGAGAVDALEKLITIDKVQALLGGTASFEAIASMPKVKLNEVVFISPSATAPDITGMDHGGYFFRLCPSDLLQATAMGILARDKGYETANVISRDDAYGQGLREVFKSSFVERGGTIGADVVYDAGAADFSGYVSAVLAEPADVIVVNALMEDGVRLFKKFWDAGVIDDYGWIVCEGVQADAIPGEVEDATGGAFNMEGVMGATPYPVGTGPFRAAYFAKYGEHTWAYGPNVYDGFILLALAIEHAGAYDGPAIAASVWEVANPPGEPVSDVAAALELIRDGVDIQYQGAGGEIVFDEYGDVWTSTARVWEYQDGEIVYVDEIELIG
ncbi:MAG: ABC transporter substrate-binding protein [Dehalococcoidia bacterium]